MLAWKPLGAVAADRMRTAHEQPYQLAQWLARFARAYLPSATDDSHTSLSWLRASAALVTDAAEIGGRRLQFALYPRDLTLIAIVDDVADEELALHGRDDAAAGDWMRAMLERYGADPIRLDAPSPYEIPSSPYSTGAVYDANESAAGLAEFARYLDNADLLLAAVAEACGDHEPGPSAIRLWPHHFDIAMLISLRIGDFETAPAIGAGLAVPDDNHEGFYFYTYAWRLSDDGSAREGPADGVYRFDSPTSASQSIATILASADQEATARRFFNETISLFLGQRRDRAHTQRQAVRFR